MHSGEFADFYEFALRYSPSRAVLPTPSDPLFLAYARAGHLPLRANRGGGGLNAATPVLLLRQ